MPVTLPPGRAMLDASPSATGSPPVLAMTMGMVRVAPNAASVPLVESVTITSTGVRTSSAARPGRASRSPERSGNRERSSALRRSQALWRAWSAVVASVTAGVRMPTRGTFVGCCARAASGHAAAPPMRVMSSRRFTRSPRRRAIAAQARSSYRVWKDQMRSMTDSEE
jgi:hypothetical protein